MQILPPELVPIAALRDRPFETRLHRSFPEPANQVVALLVGFRVGYTRAAGDHWLGKLEVDVQIDNHMPNTTDFDVVVRYSLRDWSGEFDDEYDGEVTFTVIGT